MRYLEQMMTERGISVDHSIVHAGRQSDELETVTIDKSESNPTALQALAAPVLHGVRYAGRTDWGPPSLRLKMCDRVDFDQDLT